MKTRIGLVLGLVLALATAGFAQSNLKLSVFTGYSMSAFEDQESAAGSIPLGISLGFKAAPALEVGGEFIYPLGGYKFEIEGFGEKVTTTFNQMMVGGYGKYILGAGDVKPFLKAGVAYYFGDAEVEMTGESSKTVEVEGAVGFNIGGGVKMKSGLTIGFAYNIVTREDIGMNTWAILVGYPIIK